ncbi:hypothetical protein [Winogradskyella alexanderae]|uniref:DUF4760 domain-containing protein n=1 Tax=Winogradskyella alexanderae TaxID=2877123 RepID=A0ABS7XRI0_9FLAO|nr:hypothetical protein [Winogradskyella alexanderae]MCA0132610.1 hypothetical protein [Winogradskyella alexanderae]
MIWEIDHNIIRTAAITIASGFGIFTFFRGYREFKRNIKIKRIELYNEYRDKMISDKNIKNILNLLEEDSPKIKELPRINRYKFIGYYEDIALLLNSKFIKPEIAHYMFAYYAKLCWANEDFWHDINRDSHYWRVFKEFVDKMQKLEENKMTISTNKELKFKL